MDCRCGTVTIFWSITNVNIKFLISQISCTYVRSSFCQSVEMSKRVSRTKNFHSSKDQSATANRYSRPNQDTPQRNTTSKSYSGAVKSTPEATQKTRPQSTTPDQASLRCTTLSNAASTNSPKTTRQSTTTVQTSILKYTTSPNTANIHLPKTTTTTIQTSPTTSSLAANTTVPHSTNAGKKGLTSAAKVGHFPGSTISPHQPATSHQTSSTSTSKPLFQSSVSQQHGHNPALPPRRHTELNMENWKPFSFQVSQN